MFTTTAVVVVARFTGNGLVKATLDEEGSRKDLVESPANVRGRFALHWAAVQAHIL